MSNHEKNIRDLFGTDDINFVMENTLPLIKYINEKWDDQMVIVITATGIKIMDTFMESFEVRKTDDEEE